MHNCCPHALHTVGAETTRLADGEQPLGDDRGVGGTDHGTAHNRVGFVEHPSGVGHHISSPPLTEMTLPVM